MRISDWSSDVCSSDLAQRSCGAPARHVVGAHGLAEADFLPEPLARLAGDVPVHRPGGVEIAPGPARRQLAGAPLARCETGSVGARYLAQFPAAKSTETRRVGHERVST